MRLNAAPPIEELRAKCLERANAVREALIDAGFQFEGATYQIDLNARVNLAGVMVALAGGLGLPANFAWRDRDNVDHPMTAEQFTAFATAAMNYVNAIYGASFAIKDAIAVSEAPETIDIQAAFAAALPAP